MVVTRAFAVALALLTPLVSIAGCGKEPAPGKTPTGAAASCTKDSDCTVTDFAGCCACCASAAYAAPEADLAQRKATCEKKDCEVACAPGIVCSKVESPTGLAAVCKQGACAIAR